MGLFSIFGKKSPEDLARKYEKAVADKRGYAPDRWEAIRALADAAHPATAKALLPRFTFRIEPSITDQEEKDLAFRGVVAAGEAAVPHIRAFMSTSESATWPVKMLAALLPEPAVVEIVLDVLSGEDAAYAKDPQRKIQLLLELEARQDDRIVDAVIRFLDDPSEQVRLHAISAIGAQPSLGGSLEKLHSLYETEEGARARAGVLDAFLRHGVSFPAATSHLARAKAPSGFSIKADGTIERA